MNTEGYIKGLAKIINEAFSESLIDETKAVILMNILNNCDIYLRSDCLEEHPEHEPFQLTLGIASEIMTELVILERPLTALEAPSWLSLYTNRITRVNADQANQTKREVMGTLLQHPCVVRLVE